MRRGMDRRRFLENAARSVAAAPVIVSLGGMAMAQAMKAAPAANPAHKAAAAPAKSTLVLNVKDPAIGAAGDGKTKDTVALQLAIERCSALGGGEVLAPAGDYLTGALAIRSNVTLHLEEGATLHGSPDMADYPFAQVRWEIGLSVRGS